MKEFIMFDVESLNFFIKKLPLILSLFATIFGMLVYNSMCFQSRGYLGLISKGKDTLFYQVITFEKLLKYSFLYKLFYFFSKK
jgi:hypothetical protein